jgi:hypothetical protein
MKASIDAWPEFLLATDGVTPFHLCLTGHSGLYLMPPILLMRVQRQILNKKWTRTHNTHITLDNIQKRRKLIKALTH